MNYPLFIANQKKSTDDRLRVEDKFDHSIVAECSRAGEAEIEAALKAAADVYSVAAAIPLHARAKILNHCAEEIERRRTGFIELMCREVGKTTREASTEVSRAIETFRLAAMETSRPAGEYLDLSVSAKGGSTWAVTKRVPLRAALFITPFNFPLNLAVHKIAPAIAVGCPFILKPASVAPLCALLMGEILAQTELPKGFFSILPCRGVLAEKMAKDPRIAAVSFTGSAEVGWKLKKAASGKKVALELGGNAACIVDDTFPIESAVTKLIPAMYGLAGQSCISVQRVYIERSMYSDLRDRLITESERVLPGDPKNAETSIGPMISEEDCGRVMGWINDAKKRGAYVLCGGKTNGSLLSPTLLEGVPDDSPLIQEEAFAPIACLIPFDSFEGAISAVNSTPYGLQAGVLTKDIGRIQACWDGLEVGGVIAGDVPTWRADAMPYGGVKHSGVGREGVRYAMDDLTELRLLVIRPSVAPS